MVLTDASALCRHISHHLLSALIISSCFCRHQITISYLCQVVRCSLALLNTLEFTFSQWWRHLYSEVEVEAMFTPKGPITSSHVSCWPKWTVVRKYLVVICKSEHKVKPGLLSHVLMMVMKHVTAPALFCCVSSSYMSSNLEVFSSRNRTVNCCVYSFRKDNHRNKGT